MVSAARPPTRPAAGPSAGSVTDDDRQTTDASKQNNTKKWLNNVKEDCAAMNWNLVEATRLVEDRRCSSESVRHLDCMPVCEDFVTVTEALSQVNQLHCVN